MRTLAECLRDRDAGFLQIVAELWGIDLPSGPANQAASALAGMLSQSPWLEECISSLPAQAREALDHLLQQGGRTPMADFERRYGPLRAMGPGKRDRQKPWRNPASATEALWYRALIDRAFFDTPKGPQEFAYIPEDLHAALQPHTTSPKAPLGQACPPPARPALADSRIVDDATTLLAALRARPAAQESLPPERMAALRSHLHHPEALDMLLALLLEARMLQPKPLKPAPEAAAAFLEAPDGQALAGLLRSWLGSRRWNDMAAVPHLRPGGSKWPNDPLLSRQAALALLETIPPGEWWNLESFIAEVKAREPSFQRPGGDFESWYLQDAEGAFLRGFEHWDEVEGAFLRYLIQGPLHWLGAADIGRTTEQEPITAFRLASPWQVLISPEAKIDLEPRRGQVTLRADGSLRVSYDAPRVLRYQLARISDWEPRDREGLCYRLTPASLHRASDQGLREYHILRILEEAGAGALPPSLKQAISRWHSAGVEARFERSLLLRVKEPSALTMLQSHPSTRRYLGEALGPTTIAIQEKNWPRLRDAAARLGLLIDPPSNDSEGIP